MKKNEKMTAMVGLVESAAKAKKGSLEVEANVLAIASAIERASQDKLLKAIDNLGPLAECSRLSHVAERMLSEAGARLAKKGYVEAFEALAEKGWVETLIPAERYDDPLADWVLAGCGQEFFEKLAGAGITMHGSPRTEREGRQGRYDACEKMGDVDLAKYFYGKIVGEKLGAARSNSERYALANWALSKPKLESRRWVFEEMGREPKMWAKAQAIRGGHIAQDLLDKARWTEFEILARANPKAMLAGCTAERSVWGAKPEKALSMFAALGGDLARATQSGANALHSAVLVGKGSVALAACLVAKGVDPRMADEKGETPIGLAIGKWSLADLEKVLGASPDDLCASTGRRSGSYKQSSLVEAMGQAVFAEESLARSDARIAKILERAMESLKFSSQGEERLGFQEAARAGLPECLGVWAKAATAKGLSPDASWLLPIVESMPMGEKTEAGRLACLAAAKKMGIDLDARCEGGNLLSIAIGQAVDLADDIGYAKAALGKAAFLVEAGCVFSKAMELRAKEGEAGAIPDNFWKGDARRIWGAMKASEEARAIGLSAGESRGSGKPGKRMAL